MLSLNMLIFSFSNKNYCLGGKVCRGGQRAQARLIMHFNTNLNVSNVSTSCFRFRFVFNEAFSFDSLPFFHLSDFFSIILKLLMARPNTVNENQRQKTFFFKPRASQETLFPFRITWRREGTRPAQASAFVSLSQPFLLKENHERVIFLSANISLATSPLMTRECHSIASQWVVYVSKKPYQMTQVLIKRSIAIRPTC